VAGDVAQASAAQTSTAVISAQFRTSRLGGLSPAFRGRALSHTTMHQIGISRVTATVSEPGHKLKLSQTRGGHHSRHHKISNAQQITLQPRYSIFMYVLSWLTSSPSTACVGVPPKGEVDEVSSRSCCCQPRKTPDKRRGS
jgi:hypothetical protein